MEGLEISYQLSTGAREAELAEVTEESHFRQRKAHGARRTGKKKWWDNVDEKQGKKNRGDQDYELFAAILEEPDGEEPVPEENTVVDQAQQETTPVDEVVPAESEPTEATPPAANEAEVDEAPPAIYPVEPVDSLPFTGGFQTPPDYPDTTKEESDTMRDEPIPIGMQSFGACVCGKDRTDAYHKCTDTSLSLCEYEADDRGRPRPKNQPCVGRCDALFGLNEMFCDRYAGESPQEWVVGCQCPQLEDWPAGQNSGALKCKGF